jgi:putative ABC transport system permease protein
MEALLKDVRFGWRLLARQPGFTGASIATLAIAIGANAGIFGLIDAVVLRPLPFEDPDRLVMVWETNENEGWDRMPPSPVNFLDWREQASSFEELAAARFWFYSLGGGGEPEQAHGMRVSPEFFRLLRVEMRHGRSFRPEEAAPGRDRVVIVSDALWRRRLGGEEDALGKTLRIDDLPFTVIGVLPPEFRLFRVFGIDVDLWMPFAIDPREHDRKVRSIGVYGRLRPGVTIEEAQAEMDLIARRLAEAYPEANDGCGIRIADLQEALGRNLRGLLLLLLLAVSFVLLVACTNVSNLILARGTVRRREIALRMALGAGRGRLVRQLLTESILLAVLGGAAGVVIALWAMDILRALVPGLAGYPTIAAVDGRVLAFTGGASLAAALLFGLAPAVAVSRRDAIGSLGGALKEGGRGGTPGVRGHRLLDVLVLCEVGLTVMLLIGAGLMMRSFVHLLSVERGMKTENVLTVQSMLPRAKYAGGDRVARFYEEVLRRLERLPGIESAAAMNFIPLNRGMAASVTFVVEGRQPPPGKEPHAFYEVVTARCFETLEIPILRGRTFTGHDVRDALPTVIINETMARRFWPDEDPIGKRVRLQFRPSDAPWEPEPSDRWLTIVGVAGDVDHRGLSDEPQPHVFLPHEQSPSRLMYFVVRGASSPEHLIAAVRREVLAVDPDQPVSIARTMKEVLAESFAEQRSSMLLLGAFAAVALVLAAVGIYGVVSYRVSRRLHEIGIRMALGARRRDILRLVLLETMRPILGGVCAGMVGSLALSRLVQSLVHGVVPVDAATFAGTALLVCAVALLAVVLPVRAGVRAEPMRWLRYE